MSTGQCMWALCSACGHCAVHVGTVQCMWALYSACGHCVVHVGTVQCMWTLESVCGHCAVHVGTGQCMWALGSVCGHCTGQCMWALRSGQCMWAPVADLPGVWGVHTFLGLSSIPHGSRKVFFWSQRDFYWSLDWPTRKVKYWY